MSGELLDDRRDPEDHDYRGGRADPDRELVSGDAPFSGRGATTSPRHDPESDGAGRRDRGYEDHVTQVRLDEIGPAEAENGKSDQVAVGDRPRGDDEEQEDKRRGVDRPWVVQKVAADRPLESEE